MTPSQPPAGGRSASSLQLDQFDAGARRHSGYGAALEHLYGRLDLERLDPARQATVNRDITAFRAFLRGLGDPHLGRPTVHITGTLGKGSVLASLEAILRAAGEKTGATVSPHLVEVRERIRIDGESLSRGRFAELYQQLRPAADRRPAGGHFRTVFELLTALAFHTFREEKVDIALVEVGMGGKLDATIVVEPILSVITRIGLDHTHVLGGTRGEIAADKAHVIKPGAPAVFAAQTAEALEALDRRAGETGSETWALGREAEFIVKEVTPQGTRFDLTTPSGTHRDLFTSLPGRHQAENAATAVLAADRMAADGRVLLDEGAIRAGLAETKWPGRGELLRREPPLLLDGAHTPEAARALARMVADLWPGAPLRLLLGFNKDKDIEGFLDAFSHPPERALATAAPTPRALPAEEAAERMRRRGWRVDIIGADEALGTALDGADPGEVTVVAGSLYVVGMVRRQWLHGSRR